jgi:hypothetical protein
VAHRGGAQVKVLQIETGGHLLRMGGAETLQSPLQSPLRLATKAIPRRPPEDSQGEVSCPSFKPPPPSPPTSPAPGGAEAGYLACPPPSRSRPPRARCPPPALRAGGAPRGGAGEGAPDRDGGAPAEDGRGGDAQGPALARDGRDSAAAPSPAAASGSRSGGGQLPFIHPPWRTRRLAAAAICRLIG